MPSKEQIEYLALGFILEAANDLVYRKVRDLQGQIYDRMVEIDKAGHIAGWWIVNGREFAGGTD